jgi:hypothetical protein
MPEPNRNINMSGAEYSEIFQKKQEDFNRYVQEMEVPINRLDLYLAGAAMVKDEKGDEQVQQLEGVKERMNLHGREFVKSRLRTFLSPNTYMAELTDKDVNIVYKVEIQTLQDDLYPRMNEFACSKNDISSIYSMCCSIIYMALKKSRRDKSAIYGTMSSNNTAPPQQQPQGGGMFQIPQGWTR